ncbi:ubiquinol-cytochrome C chaperone family protein [Terasakiella sp. SH-1]|uniref:ubiquinol-cytochrome C chaperone family protein n=1 Tax=Terasakiella sp. SH-1 TaxID=2560057 RepID=UPI001F0F86D6|nr:ubiquinol-cytochrome C chaperone family protein [Terasakiella sp. SH-1]
MIFSKFFKTKPAFSEEVQALYTAMVQQARQPAFYADYEVADTVEGRFDMILMHAFILMRKLKTGGEPTEEFSQSLWDLMFADMDLNLRELGVGDMGLARRVPKMAEAFYGRVIAYEEGLEADDNNEKLKSALDRNLYRKTPVSDESLDVLAKYLRDQIAHVDQIAIEQLLKGQIDFITAPSKENDA